MKVKILPPKQHKPGRKNEKSSSRLTFPRKSTKSPMALIVATRSAFSTRITKASRADVQKLVLLMAVAAYAFWEIKPNMVK